MTPAVLAGLPLPDHDDDATKGDRGDVLVVGGSCETPGAVLLGGIAALRAGAGRLKVATVASVVPALGVALPEARVVALREAHGAIDPADAERVAELCEGCGAILLGPGMLDVDAAAPIVDAVTAAASGVVVLDAGALPAVADHPDWVRRLEGRALLTPNPGELEALGIADAAEGAARFGCTVSARGADTVVAAPDGRCFVDHHGTVGLATSGSGDVATGLAAGLVARGADPVTAAVWAAALHGLAGERLGPPGFLARELLDVVRDVLVDLSAGG